MFTWWVYKYLYQLDCIPILLLIYILIESNFLIQEWTFTPPDPEKLPSIPSSVSIVTYRYMYWHIRHMSHWYKLEYTPFFTHLNLLHIHVSCTSTHWNINLYIGTYCILVHTETYMYMYYMCHKLVYLKSNFYVSHCNNTLFIHLYVYHIFIHR